MCYAIIIRLKFLFFIIIEKYESDFLFLYTELQYLEADVLLMDSTLEFCSLSCSTSDCDSFDYCQNTKTCLLNNRNKMNTRNTTTKTDLCGHYISKII